MQTSRSGSNVAVLLRCMPRLISRALGCRAMCTAAARKVAALWTRCTTLEHHHACDSGASFLHPQGNNISLCSSSIFDQSLDSVVHIQSTPCRVRQKL